MLGSFNAQWSRHKVPLPIVDRDVASSLSRQIPLGTNLHSRARGRRHPRQRPQQVPSAAQETAPPPSNLNVAQENKRTHTKKSRRHSLSKRLEAEKETLELLGWPDLCKQVASFCQTPMGAQRAVRGRLPLGESQEESDLLYKQTREAKAAVLDFSGVYDVRRALNAAVAGQVLHPLVLGAFANTLTAAARLKAVLKAGGDATGALSSLAEGIGDALTVVHADINRCINVRKPLVIILLFCRITVLRTTECHELQHNFLFLLYLPRQALQKFYFFQ